MRIAVLADIHANVRALQAVIDDLERARPDMVVNLGDCVSGPLWPEETARLLIERDWITVRGNHDRVVAARNIPPENRTDSFTLDRLSGGSPAWLSALPVTARPAPGVFACHATPGHDDTYLAETVDGPDPRLSGESEILARLGDETAPLVLFGHSHTPRLLHLASSGQTLLNPGSVGLPGYSDATPIPHRMQAGSPHARYCLAESDGDGWRFEMRAIAYDWAEAAEQARRNGRPDWARPLETGFYGPLADQGVEP
ncbi:MAG: YfcE family phosphodiesterase [Stappia sp.]|uniref:metallophosphoesterase family protein n=1 Tax=Stappia sp. TaxID=1870903 RepID=UPI000C355DEB|nr:metallophosphoesterase family protein [Stappia sp.]MAB00377.1 YfcE family phosphodiesterase [Stappia sp.]MBM19792.1 YfcE family phosphodiesterase [Stappia sp.]